MVFVPKDENLCKVLENTNLLSSINRDTLVKIFYDTTKLIYYKQAHMNKPQLKPKEVARCLNLVYYHHLWNREINVTGELAENLGADFPEGDALKYYQNKVMGTIKDKLEQEILIDEMGIDFLYKDHKAESANYLQARGKRLPWIRYTILNTNEIYTKIEKNSLLYIYIIKFMIPIPSNTIPNWFLVFAKKRKDIDKTLAFLTAIPVEKYNGFLSKLESMNCARPCIV